MLRFLDLARERYSCRRMAHKPVDEDSLNEVLHAALCAPSARNLQPWHFWIMSSEKAVAAVKKCTKHDFGAPMFVIVGADHERSSKRVYDGYDWAPVDAAIAATHLILAAHDEGLATTWVGDFDPKVLVEEYPELGNYELVGIFPLGYAALDAKPSPRHTEYRPRTETLSRL